MCVLLLMLFFMCAYLFLGSESHKTGTCTETLFSDGSSSASSRAHLSPGICISTGGAHRVTFNRVNETKEILLYSYSDGFFFFHIFVSLFELKMTDEE